MSGNAVTETASATSPTVVERGSRPAATTCSTRASAVTIPTSRSPSTTSTARTSGRASNSPASCAVAPASSTFGSVSIASRTSVIAAPYSERASPSKTTGLREQAARVQRRRHLADPDDERRAPQGHSLALGQIPDTVKCVAHLLGEPLADLLTAPEKPAEVLHPFEVRDGYAARVREDVREDDDPALGEDRIGLDGRRAV